MMLRRLFRRGGRAGATGTTDARLDGEEAVPPPIRLGDYEVVCSPANRLGRGGFGSVYKGQSRTQSEVEVAVKRVERNVKTEKFIERELKYMRECTHNNIVKFIRSDESSGFIYIIMELCSRGNLGEFIENNQITDLKCACFMATIAAGLQYLHCEKNLCHRDLKPENVLVDDRENLKIADLGLAREFFLSSSAISGTGVGTFGWLAPEVLGDTDDRSKFSCASDVFALGLLYLAILLVLPGRRKVVPFCVRNVPLAQVLQLRADGVLPEIPLPDDNSFRGMCKDTIIKMISYLAKGRCKIDEVVEAIQEIRTKIESASRSHEAEDSREVTQGAAEGAVQGDAQSSVQGAAQGTAQGVVQGAAHSFVQGAAQGVVQGAAQGVVQGAAQGVVQGAAQGVVQGAAHGVVQGAAQGVVQGIQSQSGQELKVRKLALTTLPVRGKAHIRFGFSNDFIMAFEATSQICYYQFRSGSFDLIWQKEIPENHVWDCSKHISPSGDIFLQSHPGKVTLHHPDLRLIKELASPGVMLALFPGGHYAVVTNEASPGVPVRLSVVPVTDLTTVHHQLEAPPGGAHSTDDLLGVCGREDGWLAVTVPQKRCVDIYGPTGKHLHRVSLPAEPGWPGCSSTHVLVPLYQQPRICVISWSGELLRILDHNQLGLRSDDMGATVSPIIDGRFSFRVYNRSERCNEVHTYQIE